MPELAFSLPVWLWLLPLALLPWIAPLPADTRLPSLTLLPHDRLSDAVFWVLRSLMALLIVAVLLGLAGLHQPQFAVPKVGQGAHVVLLLDRSRSMDQAFVYGGKIWSAISLLKAETKIAVARRVLNDFINRRPEDLFSVLAFSTLPIPVVSLTSHHDIVKAAINSTEIGRGLSQTNIGGGLEAAIQQFDNQPYTGSRIVLLVSDGAAQMDIAMKKRIRDLLEVNRVTVYWMYMRSATGAIILGDKPEPSPELSLHRFFQGSPSPYRAYMAENPDDLESAVADIDRLQNTPLEYEEILPQRDLAPWCYRIAALLSAVLFVAALMHIRRWRRT